MSPWTRKPLLLGVVLWTPFALAQTTLGELLEAGAKPLSPDEFRREVVQRTIVGPTATGGTLELMYTSAGSVQGLGRQDATLTKSIGGHIQGDWQTDNAGRICTSLLIGGAASTPAVILPKRCQYWFKLGDKYFFADSDTDRSAKVLSRTLKQ